MSKSNVVRFVDFIGEREAIRVRRAAGESPPWTKNKIMQEWKFCNVRRCDDRVTRWIHASWLQPHSGKPDVWFAMAVARYINWPATLAELKYPVPFCSDVVKRVILQRRSRREVSWGPAYIISTNGVSVPKEDYVVDVVLSALWDAREELRPRRDDTLRTFYDRLRAAHGFGSFMAAQVVADVKYDQKSPLFESPDWFTFAAPGPGSRRGLNRVLGRDVNEHWSDVDWNVRFGQLHARLKDALEQCGVAALTGQDLQNCLCEFDKYERIRLGEGRPKSKFRPSDEPML